MALGLDGRGDLALDAPRGAERAWIVVDASAEHGYAACCALDDAARSLLDVYLPLCVGAQSRRLVLAHLGQSLDGRVATVTGSSRFVTGEEDMRHTHRLRALFDAVLVGAQTAAADDPRLTTRLVPGRNPVRVVLDPRGRLDPELQLLRDGAAPTLVVSARGTRASMVGWGEHVERVELPADDGVLQPRRVLDALAERGLARVFVEGGGVTVSRFLQAGVLDRIQITVAPKIIGSGAPALQLPPIDHIADAITSPGCRRFLLGDDVLFDCALGARRT